TSAMQMELVKPYAAPQFTTPNTARVLVGQMGTIDIAVSSVVPINLNVAAGSVLPAGMNFNLTGTGTATISGIPAGTTGSFTFNLTADDGYYPTVTQVFTLTVADPPKFVDGPTDQATFTAGKANGFTIKTTPGTPLGTVLTESGKLPAGVT